MGNFEGWKLQNVGGCGWSRCPTRPRVGLAGGNGGSWGMDDGALGDREVDEGLDGVVMGGRLCGGGGRWGEGGSGYGWWGVLVWVGVWFTELVEPVFVL